MNSEVALENWIAFDEAYQAFTQRFPILGLVGSRWGSLHTRRKHGAALIEAGVARKCLGGRWIAHREHFPDVLFEMLTVTPANILERARLRNINTTC